jgi:hypothetical protein
MRLPPWWDLRKAAPLLTSQAGGNIAFTLFSNGSLEIGGHTNIAFLAHFSW